MPSLFLSGPALNLTSLSFSLPSVMLTNFSSPSLCYQTIWAQRNWPNSGVNIRKGKSKVNSSHCDWFQSVPLWELQGIPSYMKEVGVAITTLCLVSQTPDPNTCSLLDKQKSNRANPMHMQSCWEVTQPGRKRGLQVQEGSESSSETHQGLASPMQGLAADIYTIMRESGISRLWVTEESDSIIISSMSQP